MQSLRERLLSSENIYHSIYLANSYVQNKELLSRKDLDLLYKLNDAFNKEIIQETISNVHKRIKEILDNESEYFQVLVYFKPKKYENNKTIFRPLHTASLIDQIAMIAMLQILVYDIDPSNGKLLPSELSRLIPSNFYGNRISYNGTELFKPWQEQYHEYTSTANDRLSSYCETSEYKYEVSLDLTDFFPSINPQIVYNFISSHLPLRLKEEDLHILKAALKKLLIFDLCKLEPIELTWYLHKETKDIESSDKYVYAKGLPQGLPHTYFLANLFMLVVKDQYNSVFPGEMLFYVDDSVIFTNGANGSLDEETFKDAIAKLNASIRRQEEALLQLYSTEQILPNNYCYEATEFGVTVHEANTKSVFSSIVDAHRGSGEMYLRSLSRETSNIGFDMYSALSDAELKMLLSRTETIINALKKELVRIQATAPSSKVYRDKLLRYKKYFSYRHTILKHRCTGNIIALKEEVINAISRRENEFRIDRFFELYSDDILASTIAYTLRKCTEENIKSSDLFSAVQVLDNYLYEQQTTHSYFRMAYLEYTENQLQFYPVDKYESLVTQVRRKYSAMRQLSNETRIKQFNTAVVKKCTDLGSSSDTLFSSLDLTDIFDYCKYVRSNSNEMERMILNAIFSYVFEYDISDSFTVSKTSHRPMRYSEIRILAMLRNHDFSKASFVPLYSAYTQDEYNQTADYALLQVLDIFRMFVRDSKRIDELIRIHKYCCDTWKNGSKHLHFYTLHNQEHAVYLIHSSISLLHAISYFELKQIDFFVLFAACYLHDISMVSLADPNAFIIGNNENADLIYSKFTDEFDIKDSIKSKKALCDAYYAIDGFFEHIVRANHASNSAQEIRSFGELDFIDPTMREQIAQVSQSHGYDTVDVYYGKASGSTALVNTKFTKILLRLSDLLDMSRYRISRVILDHNLKSIDTVSRFHWISHLITDSFDLESKYQYIESTNSGESCMRKGGIIEKVILTINVLMSQTTEVTNSNRCKHVNSCTLATSEQDGIHIDIACNKGSICNNSKCNFLCKWFVLKNQYLLEELSILKDYLNRISDNFYSSEFEIHIRVISNTDIPNDVFDHLREYVNNHNM